MTISETIAKRKSVRAYMDQEIPAEDLAKILEAGQWAPNAGPLQISVIRNAQLRKMINDQTYQAMLDSGVEFLFERASLPGYQPLYGAPVLILLSGPADSANSPFNAALTAENMLLQATELGLGSCFLRSLGLVFNKEGNRALAKEAGIPDDHVFQCGVVVGYAAAENRFSAGERVKRGEVKYFD
jgi:FMN reductase [NAD(P)H]